MNVNCGTCHASYDPQISSHRSGLDCIPRLAVKIDELSAKREQDYFSFAKEVDGLRETLEEMKKQINAAFRRINLLEHPAMVKSLGVMIAKDKAAGLGVGPEKE